MVNVLVGNENVREFDVLCPKLTNDENYKIEHLTTGISTLVAYTRSNPDILVLDNSLSDIGIGEILDKLSLNPSEQKKCNTILTLPINYYVKLNNVMKLHSIVYKPIQNNELSNLIEQMSVDYNTPDLELCEVEYLLENLDFNCLSDGYKYMRDAIWHCYYNLDKLEFLKDVFLILSDLHHVPPEKIRDTLNNSIRTLNNSAILKTSNELYKILSNNGNKFTLKSFIQKAIFYFKRLKRKG